MRSDASAQLKDTYSGHRPKKTGSSIDSDYWSVREVFDLLAINVAETYCIITMMPSSGRTHRITASTQPAVESPDGRR